MPPSNLPLLALDARNFSTVEHAELQLGLVEKSERNPLFREGFFADLPRRWEARFDNVYPSVIYDEDEGLFRCWYKSFIIDQASVETPLAQRPQTCYTGGKREEGLLYATSNDGIHWEKPALGLIEFEGSRANNIVMRRATHGIHAGGVLKDPRDPDPARRYKFIHRNPRAGRMATCFSADGLRWSQPLLWPEHDAVGDTHNNAIWSPELGKYVCITRGWSEGPYHGLRTVLRSESEDFLHWAEPVEVMRGADAHDQVYSMPIVQYAGLYIGLPAIFHKGDEMTADWDTVDTELAWSADSVNWHRICPGQALIPRGGGNYPDGEYDCGCIYAAAPIIRGERVLIYYGGSNGLHNNWRESSLNLATLDIDRFAGLAPLDQRQAALVMTAPLRLDADKITVNVGIPAGGGIRAALLDGAGSSLPGYTLEDCLPLKKSGISCELRWKGPPVACQPGQILQLLFVLDNAALYAIRGASRLSD
ncbi:MAG: hypothetical protein OXG60_07450 [Chloroflexi bacterium]|nr:hypothetical protein [Chloroflexota bacterium]